MELFKILYTAMGEEQRQAEKSLADKGIHLTEADQINADAMSHAELFVIGTAAPNPIKIVQEVYAADKFISIIVLATPQQFARVRQTLQFAPFVGKNTLCISYTPSFDVVPAFQSAALRTRQRRSFSKINKIPATDSTISRRKIKVENLGIFLEQAPIGTLLIDRNENILAINRRAQFIFGTDKDKSYMFKDLVPSLEFHQLQMSAADERTKVIERAGKFLELHLSDVDNDEGTTYHIVLVNDITEQKKKEDALRESEALFRFMAEAMPQKIWTADASGYRNFFNHYWLEYTGLEVEKLLGWGWTDIIHPDDVEENIRRWKEAITNGTVFEFENRLRRKDGMYRWHLVRSIPRKDAAGNIILWIGTNTDIHDQVAFAEELERRVQERTYELEKSNNELEQFVYVTSHDLQEPIRKIRLFTDLLSENSEGMNETGINYLNRIKITAGRMTTLLKELLNFTQLSKEEQMVTTDLNSIIDQAIVDLELIIEQKKAIIKKGKLPVITAIPVQMHQLFYNLLNNALKFSKDNLPPVVEIRGSLAGRKEIDQFKTLLPDVSYHKITVSDNGIGFDEKYASQIFNIFQRLHNKSTYSGTGIGLALCKKVVTNHYGLIYADSKPGEGATFSILIPQLAS